MKLKRSALLCVALALVMIFAACGPANSTNNSVNTNTENAANTVPAGNDAPVEKNGEIYILYTSDVHCGMDQGFGYAGLMQIRSSLEAQGYTTILVDDGDAFQGDSVGTLTKGETIVKLMNTLDYDIAIPGNHDFDYGMDRFFELAGMADFTYISCNFNKQGSLVFEPYVILNAAGHKIAFVGVTTPTTILDSTPEFFQNEKGEYIYGFMQDATGEALYKAVQDSVDAARREGAELVYVLGHLGMDAESAPWTYADVIEHTSGIDVMFDGHSHDSDQIVMKDKDGKNVTRSACGTKLNCIGYSRITKDGKVAETGIWSWPNDTCAQELFGIDNEAAKAVDGARAELAALLNKVVAHTDVELTIYDAVAKDNSGNPIRMVRRAETNLGDLCADALRSAGNADVGLINGGGVRKNIAKGDITYEDIINVFPFGNTLCVVETTGEQILNALEWGAKGLPGESGGFLQVSGLCYTIDVSVPGSCITDEIGMFAGVAGERRVKDVTIGGQPLDPAKTYTVASIGYILLSFGDGQAAFKGCKVLQNGSQLDNQLLIDYIVETLGGRIGTGYADPAGEGRITIVE